MSGGLTKLDTGTPVMARHSVCVQGHNCRSRYIKIKGEEVSSPIFRINCTQVLLLTFFIDQGSRYLEGFFHIRHVA